MRNNEGEAAGYGVYYDDSSYDYMQHLKTVGEGVDGDAVLIAAPRGSHAVKADRKGKQPAMDDFFKPPPAAAAKAQPVIPDSLLPSNREMTREEVLASQAAVPKELQGLQPDMDPHLRQVLEALEDEAFVDEQAEDEDWMNELLGGGEREGEVEVEEWDFAEGGLDDEGNPLPAPGRGDDEGEHDEDDEADHEETWQDRFKAFKASGALGAHRQPPSAYDEGYSEAGDTVGSLPAMSVIGGKKRRKGTSDASGYSMSSSSMFRNKGLSTLDEMFDKVRVPGRGCGRFWRRPSCSGLTLDKLCQHSPRSNKTMSRMTRTKTTKTPHTSKTWTRT